MVETAVQSTYQKMRLNRGHTTTWLARGPSHLQSAQKKAMVLKPFLDNEAPNIVTDLADCRSSSFPAVSPWEMENYQVAYVPRHNRRTGMSKLPSP